MNAGAYGREMNDVRRRAPKRSTARAGCIDWPRGDLGLTYRHCGVPEDWIFTGASLPAAPGATDAILARMAEIQAAREATPADPQPHRRLDLRQSAGHRRPGS